jgi:hypothetical protein
MTRARGLPGLAELPTPSRLTPRDCLPEAPRTPTKRKKTQLGQARADYPKVAGVVLGSKRASPPASNSFFGDRHGSTA